MEEISLDDERVEKLTGLIKDSFRVRPNQDPVYVDVGGNLERIRAAQHQVVFGRRGSGKSCLLVHFHRTVAKSDKTLSIFIDSDELKRLGYPDALIHLMLRVTEEVADQSRGFLGRLFNKKNDLHSQAAELRDLLDLAEESDVTLQTGTSDANRVHAGATKGPLTAGGEASTSRSEDMTSAFKAKKLEALERRFPDFKRVLKETFDAGRFQRGAVIVDDFYLFDKAIQADVVDYLHRLLRGTDLYLKLGTVRHRTILQRTNGETIGISSEDVEEINLDRTFEDVDSTKEFLELMLDKMAAKTGIESAGSFISGEGRLALTLASGGVPRDYLTTLVEAVPAARSLGQQRVTPRTVYRGAGRLAYRNKLVNLREDAGSDASVIERVFADLATFCLKEERKTGFLIKQEEVRSHATEHEVIQQLMDFKLIHIIEPDTSAASGRTGRFEAYTLDFSLFMEPRLRGIRHIRFWRTDNQRRREGVREAPYYSLERAAEAMAKSATEPTESVLEQLAGDIGIDEGSEGADDGDGRDGPGEQLALG